MGYDLLTIGNSEYKLADGPEAQGDLLALMRRSRFPRLAANVTPQGEKMPVGGLHPFIVRAFGDVRVGVLGLTTDTQADLPMLLGWTISDPLAAREADDQDRKLAAEVAGLDAIVGGHSHTFLPKPIQVKGLDGREVPIVQAGEQGVVLGRLDLTFTRDGAGWRLIEVEEQLIPVTRDIPEDKGVKALLDRYLRPRPVTQLTGPLVPAYF